MKPILIAAFLFASTFTKSFAADGPAVEPSVLRSFRNTFTNATEVGWSMSEDLYRAAFYLNNQYITAYYRADGTMAALTRHISASALPVLLQTRLKNQCKGQWVTDVLEVTTEGSVQYYATLENADTKTVVKSSVTTWSLFQKEKKS